MVKNNLVDRPKAKGGNLSEKQKLQARLLEFKGLEANWDGDGADAVSDSILSFAQLVASQLIDASVKIDFCVPLRNGGIQFEFNLGKECEVEVHPNQDIYFLVYGSACNLLSKEKITLEQIAEHAREAI